MSQDNGQNGRLVPEHYFRTLCQNPTCRTPLGGFHIPCIGGTVMFACHRCRLVSLFRNEQFGIQAVLLDAKATVLMNIGTVGANPGVPTAPVAGVRPPAKKRS